MYQASVSSKNPMLLVVLLDSSASMGDPIIQFENGEDPISKFDVASEMLNDFLYNAVDKCVVGDIFRKYVDFAILAYNDNVFSPIKGVSLSEYPISVNKLGDEKHILKVIDVGDESYDGISSPIKWISDDKVYGATSMWEAFRKAKEIISNWVEYHPDSHPPILINISDGMATDVEIIERLNNEWISDFDGLMKTCEEIKKLGTNDGNTLIANAHISDSEINEIKYPSSVEVIENLRDEFAPALFSMSSKIPPAWVERGEKYGISDLTNESRLYVYNADMSTLVKFFKFGTDPTNA